ncbi:MAG: SiaB family protein kinase [Bacteroidota bacterium]
MNLSQEALELFYSEAEASYLKMTQDDHKVVIVHYAGDLNYGFANALTNRIERLIQEKIDDRTARKRFFTVFIEAIQNIRLHGVMDENEHVHSLVTVYSNAFKLCARFSNILLSNTARELAKRYDDVNSMDTVALKEKYMEVMMNGVRSDKGGAGLGIITMVMRSKNPSHYEIKNLVTGYDIFSHTVCVDLKRVPSA